MAGQTRIDGNLIDTGTDPNDIVSVSVGDGRYPRLSQDNTLAGNLTVDGQVRSDTVTDSAGTGAPSFPNGAALTDPEITGGVYLGGTGSANYLDDYEEGAWTPVIYYEGSNTTESKMRNQSGVYTKVGNTVNCYGYFDTEGKTTTGNSGNVSIDGLPFTTIEVPGSNYSAVVSIGLHFDQSWDVNAPTYGRLDGDSGRIELEYYDVNNGKKVTISDLSSSNPSNRLHFSFTYKTSE